MGEPYVIGQACLDVVDRACVQECPVQCIYEIIDGQLIGKDRDGAIENVHPPHEELQFLYGDRMLYIHPDECTSCDACLPVCPVNAIYPADEMPPEEAEFIDVNRFIFADIGS